MKRSISKAGSVATVLVGLAMLAGMSPVRAEGGVSPLRATQSSSEAPPAVLSSACATCHDLTAVQPGLYTMAEWQDTIDRMIGYGAAVTDEDVQTILAYLGTDAPGKSDGAGTVDAEAAQAVLNSSCALCHDLTAVQPGLYTMAEWQDTIDRMVGYGASVTDEQVDLILHYLGTDGGGSAADAGAGSEVDVEAAQAVLNSSCTTCHDLTAVQPGIYTAAEWTEVITRMRGYGAVISDDQANMVLDYLATDR